MLTVASLAQYPWWYHAGTLILAVLIWRFIRGNSGGKAATAASTGDEARVAAGLADRRRRGGRHVAILTLGSRGDVQPYVALAVALQNKGAICTIVTEVKYRRLVTGAGALFRPLKPIELKQGIKWRTATSVADLMMAGKKTFGKRFRGVCEQYVRQLCPGVHVDVEGAPAGSKDAAAWLRDGAPPVDLILATQVTLSVGLTIAEKLRVPCWVAKLAPDIPTRAWAPPGCDSGPPGWGNLLLWYRYWFRIALASLRVGMGAAENEVRTQVLGLPALSGGQRLKEIAHIQTLCGFSAHVVPKPGEWPDGVRITGWWFLGAKDMGGPNNDNADGTGNGAVANGDATPSTNGRLANAGTNTNGAASNGAGSNGAGGAAPAPSPRAGVSLPPATEAWLRAGPPPVCVTFGSMEVVDELDLIRRCLRAVGIAAARRRDGLTPTSAARAGVRVLLILGWATQPPASAIPRGVELHCIDRIPHDLVFPRCACVVHHGGSGTLARVVHSGVPAVVVPILPWSDQNFWGERVEALGIGRRVALGLRRADNGTPKGRVSASFDEELATALTDVLTDAVQRAATDTGAAVRAEKGVERAAGFICREGLLMDDA